MIRKEDVDGKIKIYFNNIYLGFAYLECDGFYVFMPHPRDGSGGFWSEHYLINILNVLFELNKDWNDHLESALNG